LPSPEFDVVSVNWWSAKFPKQEPTNEGKLKKDLAILTKQFYYILLSFVKEFYSASLRRISST